MPLRDIENRPGVVYDPTKKYRIFAEDLQGLDERITTLEDTPPGGGGSWGEITGTLSDQTDLQDALDAKQDALGFTPENVANKSTDVVTDQASNTKYPSVKAVFDYVASVYQVIITATNFGAFINGLTSKTTPADGDQVPLMDSADSNNTKKLSWSNIKATLKTYFDTLYQSTGAVDDTAYDSSWNGVTTIAPSKNAVYDKIESLPASLPFYEQEIPISTGTDTIASFISTSNPAGDTLFFAFVKSSATTTANIWRLTKDALTGKYYVTHTTTLTITASTLRGLAVVGSYLFVSVQVAGAATLRRYDVADLANVTTYTFSGTARNGAMFSDGTDLYIGNTSNADFSKFTLSGTVATNAATYTYTSADGGSRGAIYIGSNPYITGSTSSTFGGNTGFKISKYPLTGGAASSSVTPKFNYNSYKGQIDSGSPYFIVSSSVVGLCIPFNVSDASAVIGIVVRLIALSLP